MATTLGSLKPRNPHDRGLAAGDRLLGQASPFDTLCDIDFLARYHAALCPPSWPGQNLLGDLCRRICRLIRTNVHPSAPEPSACLLDV